MLIVCVVYAAACAAPLGQGMDRWGGGITLLFLGLYGLPFTLLSPFASNLFLLLGMILCLKQSYGHAAFQALCGLAFAVPLAFFGPASFLWACSMAVLLGGSLWLYQAPFRAAASQIGPGRSQTPS